MSITQERLRQIIREEISKLKSEAQNDADFGKVAFGSNKTVAKMQGSEPEPDTDEEAELLDAIERWTGITRDSTKLVKLADKGVLKKAKKKYPKVFAPSQPNGTIMYRGIEHMTGEFLQELMDSTTEKDWVYTPWSGMYVCKKPVKYTPHSELQSWTYDKKVAKFFAQSGIFITKQDDDFYFNPDALKAISGMKETEVIHFGKTYKNPVYVAVANFKIYFDDAKPEKDWFSSATSVLKKVAKK